MKINFYFIIIIINFFSQATAQYSDTLKSENYSTKIINKDILIPSILLGASFISLTDNEILDNNEFKEARNKWLPTFRSSLDDYLQFAPIALVYASDLIGIKSTSSLWIQTIMLLKSQILLEGIVIPLKVFTKKKRPDGSDDFSFPSGHTAEAFMAATFLHKEFGKNNIYYSISAYSIAAVVGLFRIANNKHWASDVLAGAAFGILATNLIYKTNRPKSKTKISNQFNIEPSYSNNHIKLGINYNF